MNNPIVLYANALAALQDAEDWLRKAGLMEQADVTAKAYADLRAMEERTDIHRDRGMHLRDLRA